MTNRQLAAGHHGPTLAADRGGRAVRPRPRPRTSAARPGRGRRAVADAPAAAGRRNAEPPGPTTATTTGLGSNRGPHPRSVRSALFLGPPAPSFRHPRTPIMVFRPPSALAVAPEGVPIIGGQLGDPLRDPNRPREAGFVFDTICHAYLLADERRRLRDARDRPAVMDEGNSLKSVHSVTSPGTLRYPRTSSRAGTVLMLARG